MGWSGPGSYWAVRFPALGRREIRQSDAGYWTTVVPAASNSAFARSHPNENPRFGSSEPGASDRLRKLVLTSSPPGSSRVADGYRCQSHFLFSKWLSVYRSILLVLTDSLPSQESEGEQRIRLNVQDVQGQIISRGLGLLRRLRRLRRLPKQRQHTLRSGIRLTQHRGCGL